MTRLWLWKPPWVWGWCWLPLSVSICLFHLQQCFSILSSAGPCFFAPTQLPDSPQYWGARREQKCGAPGSLRTGFGTTDLETCKYRAYCPCGCETGALQWSSRRGLRASQSAAGAGPDLIRRFQSSLNLPCANSGNWRLNHVTTRLGKGQRQTACWPRVRLQKQAW